jgi:hypothetical protein
MRVWLVVVCACGSAPPPATLAEQGMDRLVAGDSAGLAALLVPPIELGGVWFAEPACRRFAAAGTVADADVPELSRCIAGLHLAPGRRATSFANIATVVYPPGIELEVAFTLDDERHVHVGWIGYVGRESFEDALPTVAQTVLEAHRRRDVALDRAALDSELATRRVSNLFAWLKVCVDATGAVSRAEPRLSSSVVAERVFVGAATRWTFDPVVLSGQPAPVCALMLLGYPKAPELAIPFAIPKSARARPVVTLEALGPRRAGSTHIVSPDSAQPNRIGDRMPISSPRPQAGALVCIDATGAVDSVVVVRPSGRYAFDDALRRTIRYWRFAPFVVNGQPMPVCAAALLRGCWPDGTYAICT